MATIIDKIKEKKSVKYARISIKIPAELKEKIEFICDTNDIDVSEYLGAILENSEINKVYKSMKREEKQSETSRENNSNYSGNE
ncbi:hypothetical protein [Sulfurimonas sp.]